MNSFVRAVCRRWWLIMLFTLATVIAGTMPRPVSYAADAKILFKVGREYLYQPEVGNRSGPIASASGVKNAINAESQILFSRDVKQKALESFGVEKYLSDLTSENSSSNLRLPFLHLFIRESADTNEQDSAEKRLEDALIQFDEALRVKAIENTNILHLVMHHGTPQAANQLLSELIEAFLAMRQEIYVDSNADLMASKLGEVSVQLEVAEKDLLRFNAENDIYALDDQQSALVQQSVATIQELERTETVIAEQTTRLALIDERLVTTPKDISIFREQQANKLVEEARGKLFELEVEEKKLLATFRDDSKTVTRLRGEIEAVQNFIDNQETSITETVRTGRNDVYDKLTIDRLNVESELQAARSRAVALAASKERVNTKLQTIDDLESGQRQLVRKIEMLESRRQGYQQKVEDAGLVNDLASQQKSNARIIQNPVASSRPIGMSLTQRLVLSFLLGFVGGVLFASILELFQRGRLFEQDSTVLPRQVDNQRLDVPVLATIGSK